jgi:hypothetical protein
VELEEELRVVGNNLKSLEVSEEKVHIAVCYKYCLGRGDLEIYLAVKLYYYTYKLLYKALVG